MCINVHDYSAWELVRTHVCVCLCGEHMCSQPAFYLLDALA